MKRIGLTMALVLMLPLAVSAQQQERHGQGMGEGMHQGMMQGQGMHGAMMGQPGPGMLLRMQGTLGLTEDQVAELESMHEAAHAEMEQHREAARAARMQAHQAMMGDAPDLDAFQSAMEEAAQHDVQATVAMARVHMQAGEVLTDAQQATLDTVIQGMHEMQGGMHMQGEGQGEGMQQRMRQRMHQSGS